MQIACVLGVRAITVRAMRGMCCVQARLKCTENRTIKMCLYLAMVLNVQIIIVSAWISTNIALVQMINAFGSRTNNRAK